MRIFSCIFAFLLCFSQTVFSSEPKKTVTFGLNSKLSKPYVIDKDHGIEIDIVKEAFRNAGYDVKFQFVTYLRMNDLVKRGRLDGHGVTFYEKNELHYSDDYIYFQDRAMTKKDRDIKLNTVSDLFKYRVGTWQTGPKNLGGEMLKHYGDDYELYASKKLNNIATDQSRVTMLVRNRLDVNVEDILIFKYYVAELEAKGITFEYDVHELWPSQFLFKAVFKDKAIRDAFNQGLAQMKNSNRYDDVYKKYGNIK